MLRNRKLSRQQQELLLRIAQDQKAIREHYRFDDLLQAYQHVHRRDADHGKWAKLYGIYWEIKNDLNREASRRPKVGAVSGADEGDGSDPDQGKT